MGFFSNLSSGVAKATGNTGMASGGFLGAIAPFVPIAGGIASNILAGINARKARLYNSPANQIKRLREAGLPLAAGSNITGGQTQPTGSVSFGTENFNDNIGKGIIRNIDRKKLQIAHEELRSAKAAADIAAGEAKNKLNPKGVFENTNQGLGISQILGAQAESIRTQQILNKFAPIEKTQAILRTNKEMDKLSADISNSLIQNKILLEDYKIKQILASYQNRMSSAELTNLIRRNTGLTHHNDILKVQAEVAKATDMAQINIALNNALLSNETLAAAKMNNYLKSLENIAAEDYYAIRKRSDNSFRWNGTTARDLIYLGMFNPTTSSMNLSQFQNMFK